MGEYSFTDLNKGDSVMIMSGRKRGRKGTIEEITASCYLVKLDSGQYYSIKHGSMLMLLRQNAHKDGRKPDIEEHEAGRWHIY